MTQTHPIAVLTGDLIQSRSAKGQDVAAAFACLHSASDSFGRMWDSDLRFTRYRGDGWQAVLTTPGLTLDAILYLTACLRAADLKIATRISVGIGYYETLGTTDLSDATGTAFFISGDHIDNMSPKRQFAIAGQSIKASQTAIIDLTEHITSGWTATQAQAAAHALTGYPRTHDDIARALGITRQAVQSRLSGAGFSYFENALYAIRNHNFSNDLAD